MVLLEVSGERRERSEGRGVSSESRKEKREMRKERAQR
jgi:hypothetical protein